MVAAELLPDGSHVRRREREELLPVELTQARRQGLLADEAQGEGGHGGGQRQGGGQCTATAAAKAVGRSSCEGGARREPAWILGFRRKRTNLHEKYGYPELLKGAALAAAGRLRAKVWMIVPTILSAFEGLAT